MYNRILAAKEENDTAGYVLVRNDTQSIFLRLKKKKSWYTIVCVLPLCVFVYIDT